MTFQKGRSGNPKGPRPRVLTKDEYATVKKLRASGISLISIATALGMNESTLTRRMRTDSKLRDALAAGFALWGDRHVAVLNKAAFERGSVLASLAVLNSRFGWRGEEPAVERVNVTIALPAPLTDEQYGKLVEHASLPALPAPAKENG